MLVHVLHISCSVSLVFVLSQFFTSLFPQVVDTTKKISDIPEWFCGCRLNFAENLLRHGDSNDIAITTCGETIGNETQLEEFYILLFFNNS